MTIDISQEDFGTLCVCALRYCHGRRTYMPRLIQEIVQRHFKDISDNDLKLIAEDERFQIDMNLFGDYCDRVDWENFYKELREYRQSETYLAKSLQKSRDSHEIAKTEPTISKMEQVDKDINVRSKDEPQTDCQWK